MHGTDLSRTFYRVLATCFVRRNDDFSSPGRISEIHIGIFLREPPIVLGQLLPEQEEYFALHVQQALGTRGVGSKICQRMELVVRRGNFVTRHPS